MIFESHNIEGLKILRPLIFEDNRGTFRRNFCKQKFNDMGIEFDVKQGNISENFQKYTLRGFHYQKSPSQEAKLLTPIIGSIYNVVIDLRKNSKTFLQASSQVISSDNKESLLVPSGCANCFLTLSENTIIHYYMNDYFCQDRYAGFRYDDPYFKINWPHKPLIISERDLMFPRFSLNLI
jgi:dTDP-4-dehydrorhamnose 3,5-epimerase